MAATAWGPRYAPPDPTLPQPWTALIDGTTGLMYYWNLETNATQFEKPAAVLPFGPTVSQPVFSTPQQGSYTPHSYQGVSREQSQSYQFTPHYTRCQQWSQDYSRKRDYVIQKPPTRYGGPFLNTQQPSPFSQPQYGPTYQKQMTTVSPVGLNMGIKDSPPFNAENGRLALVPHQPKFPTPTPNIQQKMTANTVAIASPDAMSQSSDDIYPKNRDITAAGDKVPAPFTTFESTGFPPEVLKEIYAAGFVSPTPVQAQTWPIAIQNRDVVTIAKTDSGKTLGYLIPAFMLLRRCNNNRLHGPTIVVISPTRELALQIQNEAIKFGRSVKISCSCLYGEAPKGPQLKDLDRGADILVATPGRLNDALEMRKVNFGQVSLLVLDEADRMLDMGFEPQIRKIANEIPPRRQTLMYTATWPEEVRKIAGDLLVNPVQVNVDNADEVAANKSITQVCKRTPDHVKGATQLVPHKERETVTRCGGFGGRGGRRDDRFGGRNRNDRSEDLYDRERFENRRDGARRRGRSYSRSRSRSRSQSWSRSRTRLRRERSRSWSRGHNISPRRVRRKRQSRSRSRSRSLSWSWSRSRRRGHSRIQSGSRSPGRSWSRGSSRSRSRTPAWRESK